MNWYKYILNNQDNINQDNQNNFINYIPKIYEMHDYGFLMEYKKNYVPLYIYLKNLNDENNNNLQIKTNILESILDKINKLHSITAIKEDKKLFFSNLKMELLIEKR